MMNQNHLYGETLAEILISTTNKKDKYFDRIKEVVSWQPMDINLFKKEFRGMKL